MDLLDWTVRISGVLAISLLVLNGIARFRLIPQGDSPAIVPLVIFVLSATWVCSLCLSAAIPIRTVLYVSNGSAKSYDIHLGDTRFCLPARSYQDFTWRFAPPREMVAQAADSTAGRHYAIGDGTWFVNVSPDRVYVDVLDIANETVDTGAFDVDRSRRIHIDISRGRPYQLYSQSPLDRIYSTAGDIQRRSSGAPCRTAAR